jgi:hypothetical protein
MTVAAVRRYAGQGLKPAVYPELARTEAFRLVPGSYVAGQALGAFANVAGANDVQTITVTGTPTGGSIYLTFNGETIGPIPFNSTLAAFQAFLDASPQLGKVGGVSQAVATGGPFPGTAIVVTFSGSTLAGMWQPLFGVINALTGGATPAAAVVHTTPGRAAGGQMAPYLAGASDGTQVLRALLKQTCTVDVTGMVRYGPSNSRDTGRSFTADAYVKGFFRTADITGLDAAGITSAGGRIVWGDPANLLNTGTVFEL